MANIGVQIIFEVVGNGSQTVFTIDLSQGNYGFALPSSSIPPFWFSHHPVSAFSPTTAYSVSLSGTVLTVTFSAAPSANVLTQVNAILVF